MSCPFLPPLAQMASVLDKTERDTYMSLGLFVKPNSGEASDDLNEMDRLPLIHIVADLIREKTRYSGAMLECYYTIRLSA